VEALDVARGGIDSAVFGYTALCTWTGPAASSPCRSPRRGLTVTTPPPADPADVGGGGRRAAVPGPRPTEEVLARLEGDRGRRQRAGATDGDHHPAAQALGAAMLAARLWRRRNSPEGVATFTADGAVYVQRNDPDVAMLLGIGSYAPPVVG
jgi:hypothetical protein